MMSYILANCGWLYFCGLLSGIVMIIYVGAANRRDRLTAEDFYCLAIVALAWPVIALAQFARVAVSLFQRLFSKIGARFRSKKMS